MTGSPPIAPRRIALGLCLFILVTRLPALAYPRAIDDEQVYAVVAQVMHHGGLPYVDAVERKPPLLFLLYQGIFAVAGERNWLALHLVAVGWTLATMGLLYLIGRRLFDREAGYWAAFLYGLYLAWGDHDNLALNGELLMNLPIVAALGLTLLPGRGRSRPELFAAGGLIALALLLKQPAAIAGLPLGLYVLRRDYRETRGLGRGHSLLHGTLLAAGFAAALAIAAGLLWRAGILAEAWFWTFADHGSAESAAVELFLRHGPASIALFVLSTLPLLIAAGRSVLGEHRAALWRDHPAEFAALLMLLLVSAVGTSVNGQFLRHYFLQLLPPLALLAAPVFARIWRGDRACRFFGLGPRPLTWWLGLSAAAFLITATIGLSKNRGPGPAAVYVRDHSTPEDRLFMWGQGDRQTGLYLDAERLPASRYIGNFPLTGHVFGLPDHDRNTTARVAPHAWEQLFEDFQRHPPAFIIDADQARPDRPWPMARYPELERYVTEHFRLVHSARDGQVYQRIPATVP